MKVVAGTICRTATLLYYFLDYLNYCTFQILPFPKQFAEARDAVQGTEVQSLYGFTKPVVWITTLWPKPT